MNFLQCVGSLIQRVSFWSDDDFVIHQHTLQLHLLLRQPQRRSLVLNEASRPVPTIGASVIKRGTPWRCMFDPIRARFASSCSRNGISPVTIETSCFGRDVHVSDFCCLNFERLTFMASPADRFDKHVVLIERC